MTQPAAGVMPSVFVLPPQYFHWFAPSIEVSDPVSAFSPQYTRVPADQLSASPLVVVVFNPQPSVRSGMNVVV